MTAFRRHLASMGLAVVLCHLVMQVLVPAALCCEQRQAQAKPAVKDCCPMGSHPGQICPMHGKSRAAAPSSERDCTAKSQVNLDDLFIVLTTGGVVPQTATFNAPTGSEATPSIIEPSVTIVSLVPPGPPPRA